jgi:hypothetical protein
MWKGCLIWVACVAVGALGGFLIGWVLWKLGLEIIGSAVALVGAAVGGIVVLFAYLRWKEGM